MKFTDRVIMVLTSQISINIIKTIATYIAMICLLIVGVTVKSFLLIFSITPIFLLMGGHIIDGVAAILLVLSPIYYALSREK